MPGGCLVVCDYVDESFFVCGKFKFLQFSSTTGDLKKAYKEAGFIIEIWKSFCIDGMYAYSDAITVYSVVARKPLIK